MIKDQSPALSSKCMEIIECDTARISMTGCKMFLIIGFNKNTKDLPGQFYKGADIMGMEAVDWDYIEEKVVASGKTDSELIESAKEYKRLCSITILEYFGTKTVQLHNDVEQ